MANDKKTGRPVANNVDYFPHKCKDDKELMLIQHKYKSEGYEAFYRLQQCLGDAENHWIDLKNDLEKQMFEMGMSVSQEVVYGVIDILVGMNWLDKEIYDKENILWSDKFMNSIRAVYINRRRQVPDKEDIYSYSTCRNKSIVEYSIEKDIKEEKSKEDKPLSISEYEKLFPEKDLSSLKNYLSLDNPTHAGALKWSKNELKAKPIIFEKTKSGEYYRAWCSKCGNKELPHDKWQLKKGSECCRVEYVNKEPIIDD